MGHLGVGVGAPGDGQGAHLFAAAEQGVLDDNPGGGVGHVGELVFQADVPGGVDAAVGGLEPIIDHHPLPGIVPDAGCLQPQVLHVGGPAGPGQDLVHLDFAPLPGAFVTDQLAAVSLEDLKRFRRQDKVNALPDKNLLHQLGGVGILPVHEAVVFVEQGHPAPQALKGLGELAAQGPAPMISRRRGRSVREKTVSLVR